MNPVIAKLNELLGVTRSFSTTQQGEDEEVNEEEAPIKNEEITEVNL